MCKIMKGTKEKKILEIQDVTYTYDGERLPVVFLRARSTRSAAPAAVERVRS